MIGIIDYGIGNLASVENALRKLGFPVDVSSNFEVLKSAKALILPGVGAAGKGMENLKKEKLDSVIVEAVRNGKPLLGICLGMQLLLSFSEEGRVECLNLVKGKVRKFDGELKVPQIGWNEVKVKSQKHAQYRPTSRRTGSGLKVKSLFQSIPNRSYFYFVNSYFCVPKDKGVIVATTEYSNKFCSVLVKDNIVGTQFHPEKSGEVGLQLLQNWLEQVC